MSPEFNKLKDIVFAVIFWLMVGFCGLIITSKITDKRISVGSAIIHTGLGPVGWMIPVLCLADKAFTYIETEHCAFNCKGR